MSNRRKDLIIPSAEEDEAINRGIAADPDTYEQSASDIRQMRRVGRPRSAQPKVLLSVRYDRDVVDAFKAGGPGWQRRMNDALRAWLKVHQHA
ncbi:phage protein [Bordetella ansorpii]|uniref:Phage protein n=1 Tax=Bordetella ansorpii TaxID=288768 RepID=A0A157QJ73_9BORD|nr:BrnA antitoxin family protein [Bordetella ansorpii]SAI45817.1 phage protein [Bordetella ansorpii]